MSNLVYQNDSATGNPKPQTQTDGAADVNVASGSVAVDQTVPGFSNNNTLSPNALPSTSPLNASATAYVASLVIKATPGKLFGMSGYNSKGSAQFIQLHDAAALPAEAAVPQVVFTVAATANFSIDFGVYGRTFLKGIVVCNSSTGPTKTIGSGDIFVDSQYL